MSIRIKNAGESLIEILVSTMILMVVVTASFVFLKRGVATNIGLTNRIIAIEIAREGLEAVRNIRDTNWLKYSGDRRNKWRCFDEIDNQNACSDENQELLSSGFFQVEFSDEDKRYFLEEFDGAGLLNLKTPSEGYEYFQLFKTPSGRLVHTEEGNTPAIFFRQIGLEAEDGENNGEVKLKVVSRVQWQETNTYPSTVLETHLFDFYERDAY